MWTRRSWVVLSIFAPVLILTGIGGLTLPASASPMSNAAAYDWFHIAFGALGVVIAVSRQPIAVSGFNLGFGAIDLWQAVAGAAKVFPAHTFHLRPADHVAHVVIGAILVGAGALGLREARATA